MERWRCCRWRHKEAGLHGQPCPWHLKQQAGRHGGDGRPVQGLQFAVALHEHAGALQAGAAHAQMVHELRVRHVFAPNQLGQQAHDHMPRQGIDVDQIEQAVVDARTGRHMHAAADVLAVGDQAEQAFAGKGRRVVRLDRHAQGTVVPKRVQHAVQVGQHAAPQAFGALSRMDGLRVKSCAAGVEERLPIQAAHIHGPRRPAQQRAQRRSGRCRQAQRARKVVASAAGQHAQRRLRAAQPAGRFQRRAVSACAQHETRALQRGFARKALSLAWLLRGPHAKGDVHPAQQGLQLLGGLRTPPMRGDRVDDQVQHTKSPASIISFIIADRRDFASGVRSKGNF